MFPVNEFVSFDDREGTRADVDILSILARDDYQTPDMYDDLDLSDIPTDAEGYVL